MKKISLWARHHRWQTRFLIIIIYIILNLIGLFFGDILFASGVVISSFVIYAVCFVFLLGLIFYPSRKDKDKYQNFYSRQKFNDFILVTTSFLLIVSFGNHYNLSQSVSQSPFHSIYSIASTTVSLEQSNGLSIEKPVKKKKAFKSFKQKLKENIRLLRKEYKDASPGERTALIILSVIVALGLLLLVAALSCNISCGGAEGAALAVGILGTALIIFLLVKVIKRINRGKPKKEPTPESGG